MTDAIHHLVAAETYQALAPGEPYLPAAFAEHGFIHCTQDPASMAVVANLVFRDEPGTFLVLVIDPARVTSEVRFEPPSPPAAADSPLAGVLFPHIYGPLNRDAIISVRAAVRAPDGRFLRT